MKILFIFFLLPLSFTVGCRDGDSEYNRGWYNACSYVIWKNSHRAVLPCEGLLEYSRSHPEINFSHYDTAIIRYRCSDDPKTDGWLTLDSDKIIDSLKQVIDSCGGSYGNKRLKDSLKLDQINREIERYEKPLVPKQ